jgi:hypothetical protein
MSRITCPAVRNSPAAETKNAVPLRERSVDFALSVATQSRGATECFIVSIASMNGSGDEIVRVVCPLPANERDIVVDTVRIAIAVLIAFLLIPAGAKSRENLEQIASTEAWHRFDCNVFWDS